MNLPQLPADKVNHFLYGQLIATIMYAVTKDPLLAVVMSLWAGMVKEILDAFFDGNVDPWDVIATTAGGAEIALIVWLS